MYNAYNSRNNYLDNYKNIYNDNNKQWADELITDLSNCEGNHCVGSNLMKHQDKSISTIMSLQGYLFDKFSDKNNFEKTPSSDQKLYKKENYFQNTGFTCYNKYEGSHFTFPMMCGTSPCIRYNYIINNSSGSKNLLKNLSDNNKVIPDKKITEDEWIIPGTHSLQDEIKYNSSIKTLEYNSNPLNILDVPYINKALSGNEFTFKNNILYLENEKSIKGCSYIITQHDDSEFPYHTLIIKTKIVDDFINYLDEVANETTTNYKVKAYDDYRDIKSCKEEKRDYEPDEINGNRHLPSEDEIYYKSWDKILNSELYNADLDLSGSIRTYVQKQREHGNTEGKCDTSFLDEVEIVLLKIQFENYLPESLDGLTNHYLTDNLFDNEITCKPIILPASGRCEKKYIHTKDYDYIKKNYKHLVDFCVGGEGFNTETQIHDKIYGKIFLSAFAMLILYMLYRIDKKR